MKRIWLFYFNKAIQSLDNCSQVVEIKHTKICENFLVYGSTQFWGKPKKAPQVYVNVYRNEM